ncbi:transketolase [Acetobacter orientalis]|uniref:Transketolase n=1 Tax=Acetobacter orientalis TaxID=146474 RepID=A0A2Z5ZH03_9PROT|nr:transketolase [Acetobacter orientalis]
MRLAHRRFAAKLTQTCQKMIRDHPFRFSFTLKKQWSPHERPRRT